MISQDFKGSFWLWFENREWGEAVRVEHQDPAERTGCADGSLRWLREDGSGGGVEAQLDSTLVSKEDLDVRKVGVKDDSKYFPKQREG